MKLAISPVVFDRESHTYTYQGRHLSGITSMLSRQLFGDKYAGVSEKVLKHAAERGSYIHQMCELADRIGITGDCAEAKAYVELCATERLVNVESEYLVSDLKHYASCIDKVFAGDGEGEFGLADIKTTYALDKEYLRWQLSVYAYLFELQNPGAKVTRLIGIWLRDGKAKTCGIERIDTATIKALLAADATGGQFANTLPAVNEGEPLPKEYQAIEGMIIAMQAEYDYLDKRLKEMKARWLSDMEARGITKFKSDRISITRRAGGETLKFDKDLFDKDYPGVYDKYLTTVKRKGSVTLKIL